MSAEARINVEQNVQHPGNCCWARRFTCWVKASIFLAVCVSLSSCDDHFTLSAYDQSPIIKKIKNKSFSVGDTIVLTSEYDEICFIYPLGLISEFSKKDWEADFSEDYFRVWIRLGETERVELIHRSWIAIEGGNDLCAEGDEEIVVSRILDNGFLYLTKKNE